MHTLKIVTEYGEYELPAESADKAAVKAVIQADIESWKHPPEGNQVEAHYSIWDEAGKPAGNGCLVVDIEPDHDTLIRRCGGDPECDHDWAPNGPCDGVRGHGGTKISLSRYCRDCGLHQTWWHPGAQRNPGEIETVEYRQPDVWCADCEADDCDCPITNWKE